jgi:hypothetical protein
MEIKPKKKSKGLIPDSKKKKKKKKYCFLNYIGTAVRISDLKNSSKFLSIAQSL